MSATPAKPAGSPVWIDLSTSDIDGAKAFYAELFGWTYQDLGAEMGHYHFIRSGEVPVGGLMSNAGIECPSGEELPTEWGVYLSVPDAEAALAAAAGAGGKVIVPAMPVAQQGVMAVVADPAGAAIGMWEPREFAGLAVSGQAGTPVWFEAMSTAAQESVPFYEKVFGWEPARMEAGGADWFYVTNAPGELATAGLCDARGIIAEGTASYWRVYLGITGIDAALARIPGLGGAVLDGPADSPYGRLATVADPQGATFQLICVD